VARLAEGHSLRMALGAKPDIYVLDGYAQTQSPHWQSHNLSPVINNGNQLNAWRQDYPHSAYGLHIDTGMNRLGIRPQDFQIDYIKNDPNLRFIMSHLACGDEPANRLNHIQYEAFLAAINGFEGPVSLSASAGALLGDEYQLSFTRPGIGLYGSGPQGVTDPNLRPVVSLYARLLSQSQIKIGETIGYGARFQASKPMRLATIGLGYADGFHRSFGEHGYVLCKGQKLKILGRVSMDLMTIDITDCEIGIGDEVEIFGPHRLIDEMAHDAGTIGYEILTSLSPRLERHYIGMSNG